MAGPSILMCLYSTQSCAYPCRFSLSISAFSEWHSRSQVCSICLHSSILLCIICRLCSRHSIYIKRLYLQTHVQCSVNTVDVCTYVHIFSIPMHTCIYIRMYLCTHIAQTLYSNKHAFCFSALFHLAKESSSSRQHSSLDIRQLSTVLFYSTACYQIGNQSHILVLCTFSSVAFLFLWPVFLY